MGKRIKVWGWQDPTQVIAQEMAGRAKSKQQGGTMEYDYSLIPPKCPDCGAMPIDDETPKSMYREHGECYCEETQEESDD
tara:strand:+ start:318 stop:557 length:240 start_codon:yes stop_codon:yes gene_type:complete